jgi:hypothetical protein
VQAYGVGLLRLTLDLTRRRPDIFAEIGAAEVVKGAVSTPTPAQKRGGEPPSERRYTPSARGGWSSRRQGGDRQPDRPVDKLHIRPPSPALGTAKNDVLFPPLPPLFFLRSAEEWRVDFTQFRMK